MRKSKLNKIVKHYTRIYKDIDIETIKDSLFLYRLEFMVITSFDERATTKELHFIKESIINNLQTVEEE